MKAVSKYFKYFKILFVWWAIALHEFLGQSTNQKLVLPHLCTIITLLYVIIMEEGKKLNIQEPCTLLHDVHSMAKLNGLQR